MLENLTDILFPENYHNNSGLYQIHYVPLEWIESIAVNDVNATLTLVSGKSWKLIESSKVGSGLSIEPDEDDNGIFYKSTVSGHLPYKSSSATSLFNSLQKLELVLRVTDNDGNQRFIGNLAEPCEFRLKQFNTQGVPGNKEGHWFQFTCVNSTLPPHA